MVGGSQLLFQSAKLYKLKETYYFNPLHGDTLWGDAGDPKVNLRNCDYAA